MAKNTINYYSVSDILFWQGIRYLSDNFYITCGTYSNQTGVLNIGSIEQYNPSNNYTVIYPESVTTSVYGPNYVGNGIYSLVGSYKKNNDGNVYGFYFYGLTSDLSNPNNYKTLFTGGNYTYLHSTMENLLVGNYDNILKYGTFNLPLGPISAFLFIINIGKKIEIVYPGSISNTVYGVWYNGNNSYTLCGGYSNYAISITDVYSKNGLPRPIDNAYLVNYNAITNTFINWTSINYPNSNNLLTHFEGISSSSPNKYELAADTINSDKTNNIASYINVSTDLVGNFIVDKWTDIKYPLPGTITSANSVSNNILVGANFNNNGSSIAFQSIIKD